MGSSLLSSYGSLVNKGKRYLCGGRLRILLSAILNNFKPQNEGALLLLSESSIKLKIFRYLIDVYDYLYQLYNNHTNCIIILAPEDSSYHMQNGK